MAIWNDPSPYTEYNDLIKQYEEFQTKLANGQGIAKRSQLLLTAEQKKQIWQDEQRHKWMCGEQPEYVVPEDCPF